MMSLPGRTWLLLPAVQHRTPSRLTCAGIAPFRSFLEERHALAVQAAPPQAVQAAQPQAEAGQGQGQAAPAPCFLFFGCRGQAVDYYYREQWQQMQAAGVLDPGPMGLVTAFSRDQASKVGCLLVCTRRMVGQSAKWLVGLSAG